MRIAWFSPVSKDGLLNGSGAGTSEYLTEILVPLLRQRHQIEIFTDGSGRCDRLAPCHHYTCAFEKHETEPFDIFLYQIEDRPESDFARIAVGLMPGVVWFHDYLMRTHGPVPILNSRWRSVAEMLNRFPEASQYIWPRTDIEYPQTLPHALREGAYAALAIFSDPRSRSEFERNQKLTLASSPPATAYLPLPVTPRRGSSSRHTFGEPLILLTPATPWIEDRMHKVLSALESSSSSVHCRLIWLVGDSEVSAASELASDFPNVVCEIRPGRSANSWCECLNEGSLAVHCRFSAYGQLGLYYALSQSRGVPSIITSYGSAEFESSKLNFVIEPGEHEARQIALAVSAFARLHPADRIALSEALVAESERLDGKVIASELEYLLQQQLPRLRAETRRWKQVLEAGLVRSWSDAQRVAGAVGGGLLAAEIQATLERATSDVFPFPGGAVEVCA